MSDTFEYPIEVIEARNKETAADRARIATLRAALEKWACEECHGTGEAMGGRGLACFTCHGSKTHTIASEALEATK